MAGYATTERITHSRPRFVGIEVGAASLDAQAYHATGDHERPVDSRPLDRQILDAWSELCEEWSQATFFLFDPNSWR
jgi:hypothetical protein